MITWILCVSGTLIVLYVGFVAASLFRSFDTQYAPGYSAAAFNSIKIGDKEQNVIVVLGIPFTTNYTEPYIDWVYSAKKQSHFSESGEAYGTHTLVRFKNGQADSISGHHETSCGIGQVTISLDNSGFLNLTEDQIHKLEGKTSDEIKKQFGEPTGVYEFKAARILRYSRSPSSSNYLERLIGLDAEGKVVHIWKEIYWD